MSIVNFIYAISPVIIVMIGIGIVFGVVKLKSVLFFVLFLFLLPFAVSTISQAVNQGSALMSWKTWLVVIILGLVAIRLVIGRVFRG